MTKETEILQGEATDGLNSIEDEHHDVVYQRMKEEMAILQDMVKAGITSIDNVLDSPSRFASLAGKSTEPCRDVADAADVTALSDLPSEDCDRLKAARAASPASPASPASRRASRRGQSRKN